METCLRKPHTKRELKPTKRRPVIAVLIPGPQHSHKVKYFPVTITVLISVPEHPPKVKYFQITMQTVNQAAGNLQDHHHQSLANLTLRSLYSPLPEMAIVHRSMHNVIHTVRKQHCRALT